MEVDDLYAGRAQPFHAALEVAALSDDHHAETKLPHKAAAIPAGRQRCDHAEFAIAALPPRITEGVGFAMQRRISVLHAAVVSGPKDLALSSKIAAPIGMPPSASPLTKAANSLGPD